MSNVTEVVDSSYNLWYSYKLNNYTSTSSQPHTYLHKHQYMSLNYVQSIVSSLVVLINTILH